ncbi:unnamed protein product [Pseudo-nitzschia multistriata]|uniref:Uncharacterized protein n=1 Tax=Pseudo-nitzschia multistriata TaxID=183589 RepID=A0A448Z2D8_9STRA|nr:unnamed protein product [Pseudo-nitzschia multistriata]
MKSCGIVSINRSPTRSLSSDHGSPEMSFAAAQRRKLKATIVAPISLIIPFENRSTLIERRRFMIYD